jgi:hypothetical protein
LVFLHPDRKLAGTLTVRGDEKEPPVVKLVPAGSITGRVLDRDGRPAVGVKVRPAYEDASALGLIDFLETRPSSVFTDQEGHFQCSDTIPGLEFDLRLYRGANELVTEPRVEKQQVGSGQTLHLGDLRLGGAP